MRSAEIRALVSEAGPEGYLHLQDALLHGGVKLPNGRFAKAKPEDFSLRALWEGLVGPADETLPNHAGGLARGFVETGTVQEAIGSSAFPSAVGQLIAANVIDGYDSVAAIGDQLVTTVPSKLRGERMVGFTSLQGPKTVGEGQDYEESSFEDKYVTTTEAKKGRLLSLTEEAIYFDQTGEVLRRAAMLGEMTRQERERVIVRGVADVASTERVYRPQGAAAQLYSAGNKNLNTGNNPLVDWTTIQLCLTFHATNITDDRQPDDSVAAQPILWQPKVLLTAMENAGVAARIIAATAVFDATTGVHMQTGNPLALLLPGGIKPLSSPFLDTAQGADQWDDASDWFLGDFPRQFIWKEIWPLQVLRYALEEAQAKRDVVVCYKVRYYGGLNAVDHRYVIKMNAAA